MARHWKGWRDKKKENWLAFFFLSDSSCRLLLLHPTWDVEGKQICITTMKYYRLCLDCTPDRHALETLVVVVCCLIVCVTSYLGNPSDCSLWSSCGKSRYIQSYRRVCFAVCRLVAVAVLYFDTWKTNRLNSPQTTTQKYTPISGWSFFYFSWKCWFQKQMVFNRHSSCVCVARAK